MRRSLIGVLACPKCGGPLSIKVFGKEKSGEITEGYVRCGKCEMWYPIIKGIPRMLPPSMINRSLLDGFFEKHKDKIPENGIDKEAGREVVKERTSKSFGFQWNVFSEMFPEYEQNFLNYIKPLEPSFFRNKLVLDAGCGFGRHTYYAAKYGAEVIGFDLSDAVEAAYRNCKRFKNVNIVQGDIYNPPFRPGFDFIMSIGVLHHLPISKQEEGFLSLVKLMRKGTMIFAWLYGREGRWFKLHVVEGIVRRVTTRMPFSMLYYLCYLPAALYHSFNILHSALAGNRVTRRLSGYVPFKGYAKFPFRVKHADAFDLLATPVNSYYTKQQVERWAKDAKLREVSITDIEKKSWRLFGKR